MELPRRLRRLYGGAAGPVPEPTVGNTGLTDTELNELAEAGASFMERIWGAKAADVIAAMVDCGCPRRDAEQQMKVKGLAFYARQFYLDYVDAQLGDGAAKEKVERCREAWGGMNRRREMQR